MVGGVSYLCNYLLLMSFLKIICESSVCNENITQGSERCDNPVLCYFDDGVFDQPGGVDENGGPFPFLFCRHSSASKWSQNGPEGPSLCT